MAIASLSAALTQLNANLLWEYDGAASAKLALEAVRYLLFNRAYQMGHVNSSFSYESLKEMEEKITLFLAASDSTQNRTSFTSARSRWS